MGGTKWNFPLNINAYSSYIWAKFSLSPHALIMNYCENSNSVNSSRISYAVTHTWYLPANWCMYVCTHVCMWILRGIFGSKRDENGEWRRLHNEELHSLYRSTNIVRVIKSRRLRWAGHVARLEEGRSAFKILTSKPTGKRLWDGLGVDGRTILEWTLKR